MLSIGIVGLPNVGKSTLFKALTKKQVAISNYPFCTIEPNHGIVAVPDERIEKLAALVKPAKVTSAIIEFVDIAGLVKKAHQGEGLGNQFLAQIREVDAILEVVRCFTDEKIAHVEGAVDPQRDMEIIKLELAMKDLETVEKRLEKTQKEAKSGDQEKIKELAWLPELKKWLNGGKPIINFPLLSDERFLALLKDLALLTAKPTIYVLNKVADANCPLSDELKKTKAKSIELDLKLEAELSELTTEEIKELNLPAPQLDQLIKLCYDVLNIVTFFTIAGGQELRAWTVSSKTPVVEAAGKIHQDFQEKFIKAEVINWEKLLEANSWHRAREKGLIRTEGKEYLVQDGEVVEIKI